MYDCKLKCISSGEYHFKDKIYKIIDNELKCESGIFKVNDYNSIEEINNNFRSQFELYKEETIKEKFINMVKEEPLVFEDYDGYRSILWNNKFLYSGCNGVMYNDLESYDDNLLHTFSKNDSISKIYKSNCYSINTILNKENLTQIWKREENLPTVEITIDEIAKLKGCKPEQIKIKK